MSGTGGGLIRGHMVHAPMEFRLQPGGSRGGEGCFLRCPKCETQAAIRRSEKLTPLVTQLDALCSNTACGHTFRVQLEITHSISPGNIDRPDLHLPILPRDQLVHVVPPPRGSDPDQPSFLMNASEDAEAA